MSASLIAIASMNLEPHCEVDRRMGPARRLRAAGGSNHRYGVAARMVADQHLLQRLHYGRAWL
jgi:hypothetical protein